MNNIDFEEVLEVLGIAGATFFSTVTIVFCIIAFANGVG